MELELRSLIAKLESKKLTKEAADVKAILKLVAEDSGKSFDIWLTNAKNAAKRYDEQFKQLSKKPGAKDQINNQISHLKNWVETAKKALSDGTLHDKLSNSVIQLTNDMKTKLKSVLTDLYKVYQSAPVQASSVKQDLVRLASALDEKMLVAEADQVDSLLSEL